ncbi:pro-resilin-like [Oratosquilla oratoria]|uniref:pro-resilin-like n=1 Tax=Oratosquilla oratoria TaxID=337810 RepID=UPI003F764E0D
MSFKIFILLGMVALACAVPVYGPPKPDSSEEDYGPAKYDFNWEVKDEESGNDFGQQETRDGDRTEGSYYVYLPDGRLMKVTYYVDGDSGFVVNVEYEGEARYPEGDSSEETFYSPPSPPRPFYGRPN